MKLLLTVSIFGLALGSVSCKQDSGAGIDASEVLTFAISGAQPVPEIKDTDTAGSYASANAFSSAAPANGIALTQSGSTNCDIKPGQKVVTSASYGYEQEGGNAKENGQSYGTVALCKSQGGELGQIDWEDGELCMVPESVGVTSQLFLMPGQTIQGKGSKLSVTELCNLATNYYIGQAGSNAFNLTQSKAPTELKGDSHYSNVTGKRGQVTASLAGKSFPYSDALVLTYRDGGGFGLQGGGADFSRTHAVMSKNDGFRAFVFTEKGFDDGGSSVSSAGDGMQGFSSSDGFYDEGTVVSNGPSQNALGLTQSSSGTTGVGAAGTFKIYFGQ